MMTDPTLHLVSYNGQQFSVSAYPFGPKAGDGKCWSVRTTDGYWHVACARVSDRIEDWRRAEAAIIEWLIDHYGPRILRQG